LKQARREAEALLARLTEIAEAMQREREEALSRLEVQVFDLAVAIARRVVRDELAARPALLVGIVKEALRRLEKTGAVKVRVHPDVHALFLEHLPGLRELHGGVLLEADPSVPSGGPLVVGPAQEVVTDPDEQIRHIVEQVRDSLASA